MVASGAFWGPTIVIFTFIKKIKTTGPMGLFWGYLPIILVMVGVGVYMVAAGTYNVLNLTLWSSIADMYYNWCILKEIWLEHFDNFAITDIHNIKCLCCKDNKCGQCGTLHTETQIKLWKHPARRACKSPSTKIHLNYLQGGVKIN